MAVAMTDMKGTTPSDLHQSDESSKLDTPDQSFSHNEPYPGNFNVDYQCRDNYPSQSNEPSRLDTQDQFCHNVPYRGHINVDHHQYRDPSRSDEPSRLDNQDQFRHNVPYQGHINVDHHQYRDPRFVSNHSQNATMLIPANPCTNNMINTSAYPHGSYSNHEMAYTGDISSGRRIAASYSEALSRSTVPSDDVPQYSYPDNFQMNCGFSQPSYPYFGTITTQPRNSLTVIQPRGSIENVSDYMCLSVVGCLCCWLIGFAALRASNEVNKAKKVGAMHKAKESSEQAMQLSIIAIVCGVLGLGLSIGLAVFLNVRDGVI